MAPVPFCGAVVRAVDGRPRHNWSEVIEAINGKPPIGRKPRQQPGMRSALRDRLTLVDAPAAFLPLGMWDYVTRVGPRVCYSSVFGESWVLESKLLSGASARTSGDTCGHQPAVWISSPTLQTVAPSPAFSPMSIGRYRRGSSGGQPGLASRFLGASPDGRTRRQRGCARAARRRD